MKIGISVRDLSLQLRNGFRLHVSAFDCRPGTTVCLVGANGSGKSLLLEALCGLTSGVRDVNYYRMADGQPTAAERGSFRAGVQLQRFGLWTKARVREIVSLLEACGGGPDPEDPFLRRIGDRFLGQLSTGERQYLMFCLAFYSRTEILYLDEPTLGLDAKMQEHVLRLLQEDPRTKVLATHSFAEVIACSRRCYVLCEGRSFETFVRPMPGLARQAIIQLVEPTEAEEPDRVLRSLMVDVDGHRAVELLNRELLPFIGNEPIVGTGQLAINVLLSRTLCDECRASA